MTPVADFFIELTSSCSFGSSSMTIVPVTVVARGCLIPSSSVVCFLGFLGFLGAGVLFLIV